MYQIGKKIRRFREQKGISQKDFAAAIGQSNAKAVSYTHLTLPTIRLV